MPQSHFLKVERKPDTPPPQVVRCYRRKYKGYFSAESRTFFRVGDDECEIVVLLLFSCFLTHSSVPQLILALVLSSHFVLNTVRGRLTPPGFSHRVSLRVLLCLDYLFFLATTPTSNGSALYPLPPRDSRRTFGRGMDTVPQIAHSRLCRRGSRPSRS